MFHITAPQKTARPDVQHISRRSAILMLTRPPVAQSSSEPSWASTTGIKKGEGVVVHIISLSHVPRQHEHWQLHEEKDHGPHARFSTAANGGCKRLGLPADGDCCVNGVESPWRL